MAEIKNYLNKALLSVLLLVCMTVCTVNAEVIKIESVSFDTQALPDEIIPYQSIGQRQLMLHVFYAKENGSKPSVKKEKAPALLLFHGGGWNRGTPKQFYDQANYFSQLGITVISVEYRLWHVDKTPPNVSVMDAKSAYRWVVSNAERLGIDAHNIAAGGASAGGHLAASLASIPGFNERDQKVFELLPIKALVLLNPVVDMSLEGFGNNLVADYWRAISPLHNIEKGHPPAILFLGTDDHVLSVATANKYRDKVRAVGAISETVIYPDKKHGFFNRKRSHQMFVDTTSKAHQFLIKVGFILPNQP